MEGTMRSLIRRLACIAIAALFIESAVGASSIVRGRVIRVTRPNQSYPASGIPVSVFSPQRGRSTFAYSGADGMYYLYNIPSGAFTLEVWVSKSDPMTFPIQVYDQPYTDIAPIQVP